MRLNKLLSPRLAWLAPKLVYRPLQFCASLFRSSIPNDHLGPPPIRLSSCRFRAPPRLTAKAEIGAVRGPFHQLIFHDHEWRALDAQPRQHSLHDVVISVGVPLSSA